MTEDAEQAAQQRSSDDAGSLPEPAEPGFQGPVVAVGASAGGLDALERLFSALPPDTGAAFVVIQHLSPDHKSIMDNLLSRYTRMPVCVAAEGQPLRADAVFLIPAGKTLQLRGDRLHLDPKPEHGLSLPIDIFFESMAEQCLDRAVAVVLSGTGSDGSRGLAAVNANGGFVFVQEPHTAKFDGMPRSAMATGLADVVAPAEELAARLVRHLEAPRSPLLRLREESDATLSPRPLDGILEVLATGGGLDFREYKPNTVLRRIERRMQVLHADSLTDYHRRVAASAEEQVLLRRELLIPVTRFFRDGEVFEMLAEVAITPLLQGRAASEPLRVWVACCATGEEAYSVAILFAEAMQRLNLQRSVKIFATDAEQQYLDHAAAGQYPPTIAAEVSAERLDRFFMPRPGGFAVRPEIRQMVIFARHNLIGDPPFTRMDLVSCRNALIYLQPAAQERALRSLQFALRLDGHLLLGPSESLGSLQPEFATVASRQKIYRLVQRNRLSGLGEPLGLPRSRQRKPAHEPPGVGETHARLVEAGRQQVMQAYAPPTLLVGPGRELLHVYGDASALLRIADGSATLDVVKLLPRELAWAAGLLLQAPQDGAAVQRSAPLRLPPPADSPDAPERMVVIAAQRLGSGQGSDDAGLVLLSFEPASGASPLASAEVVQGIEQQRITQALELELERTRESLQATIEELEASNEELQATNEEMMASNEELQSTNEELQSVNEELYTVNAEYQEKVDLLNSVNADLENVSRAAAIPTLFVDDALRLTRITPEAAQLFKVREVDLGRSLEDFTHLLDHPSLFADLRRTIETGRASEFEVRSRSGEWWLARMHPYTGHSTSQSRAVMTFFNITSVKDSQRLQAIIDSLPEHVAVLDQQGTIQLVNRAWRQFAHDNGDAELRASGPGSSYISVCAQAALHDDDARFAYEGMLGVLEGRRPTFTMRYPCHSPSGHRWFQMHVGRVVHAPGGVVVSHVDVSDWAPAAPPAP